MADYRLRNLNGLAYVQHVPTTTLIPLFVPDYDVREFVEYQAWLAAGNTPDPDFPSLDPTVPPVLDRRQFWMRLALMGKINEQAAMNAMEGDIPDVIETFILTLSAGDQFMARMFFKGDRFERVHALQAHTKAGLAFNDAQLDQFFRDAFLL
ncbi:hypothetical protein CQ14_06895 [Bradyrhizobium lablabi]|uniref:Uncharacterized protein n=1 Tax=Bradyrhizobium lablabi TaxID=722472 RepID=A0A0R3MMX5_9BRAD|nr:hypothetical protein [Bradyrhizobium lablabi]KRR21371.1 hypothetical protein CQ14_06895 [Bradyrhizobium lablabi]